MYTEQQIPFRTKTIGVRVTVEDYDRLRSMASSHGKLLGEWCRDILLYAVRHPEGTGFHQALLGEVIALRRIVFDVTYCLATDQPITSAAMKAIWKDAEASKRSQAVNLLRQASADFQLTPPSHTERRKS
jgi:hypothetical protein